MTKAYLKFPQERRSYLPKMINRRMRLGHSNFNVAYKSDGGDDDTITDEDKEVKAIQAIQEQVKKFQEKLGEKADAETIKSLNEKLETLEKGIKDMQAAEISQALKDINGQNEKLWKQIVELQEKAAEDQETGKGKKSKKELVSDKQVKDLIDKIFVDGKKTKASFSVELKAAETFGWGTFFDGGENTVIDAFTGRVVDPRLYQRNRKRNLILDNFQIGTIGVPKLIYLIKVEDGDDVGSSEGDSGGADWIASGQIKPKRSFRVTTGEAEAKKVAIFATAEDKLLRDVASLGRWIREDLMDEMREKINDGLLNNDPDVNALAPLGLKTNASQYTPTPAYNGTIDDANYIDMIIAAKAWMAYNKERPDRAFVSTDVYHRITHLKDNEARYQNNGLVYTNALGQLFISGIPIIEADEEDIPSTHLLLVGMDLGWKAYAYGNMVLEDGRNGEDFRYDRTSFRGYQEFLTFFPENREKSVLYDTWANIESAISAGS